MQYSPIDVQEEPAFACEWFEAGVCAAAGFRAAAIHAGFQPDPTRLDLALICADVPCATAGVFTQNRFCAAPVSVDKANLCATAGYERAMVINTKYANAACGEPGIRHARDTCEEAAALIGCAAEEVLVASTGVIGQHLDMSIMRAGLPRVAAALGRDPEAHDLACARAIMTTDTRPKRAALKYLDTSGAVYTIGGMCKGSGMISPDMATMIALITTDAPATPQVLEAALRQAVRTTFNCVTIDSDTSTNDTCILMASGQAAGPELAVCEGERFEIFAAALHAVCLRLACAIAADGEGATRLVRVCVVGAADEAQAADAARTVATSPLVKTAIAGHDANWGRVAAALGRSQAVFRQEDVDIDILGIPVCRSGLVVDFDEDEALRRFEEPQVDIVCSLGAGNARATIWTCDFTHDYVSINADYRT